ncbi:MAG TPA: MBL fold metallo-hydrolase [Myxococcota bacterium]|jgi:glyoxylase-like metal-dependent hydrolase (beta-lactamase superfamily II)|nr:MBL fold metallo-hydrolase [Myxococcota bacterium]
MKKLLGWIALVVVVLLGAGALYATSRVRSLESEPLSADVHMLEGLGGNVAVLRTRAGAVVVDTMSFRMQGQRIRELAEQLGGGPVQAVINTHYHLDHTHGNPGFAPGTPVVATEKTLEHLKTRDASYWKGAAAETLPNDTFSDVHDLSIGGKTIRCFHPGRGHTDGDLVVLFVEDRVLHTGDLFFNHRYPSIDLEAGGSVREWADTLDRVLALDFDKVIPGHGPAADRAALEQFRDFMRELWRVTEDGVAKGESLAELQRTAPLHADAGYETMAIPFVLRLDRSSVLERAYQEATRAKSGGGA